MKMYGAQIIYLQKYMLFMIRFWTRNNKGERSDTTRNFQKYAIKSAATSWKHWMFFGGICAVKRLEFTASIVYGHI